MSLPVHNKGFLGLRVYLQSPISFWLSSFSFRHIHTSSRKAHLSKPWLMGWLYIHKNSTVRLPERIGKPIHIHYVLLNLTLRDPLTLEHTICPIHIPRETRQLCKLIEFQCLSSSTPFLHVKQNQGQPDARADKWSLVWVLCVIPCQNFRG